MDRLQLLWLPSECNLQRGSISKVRIRLFKPRHRILLSIQRDRGVRDHFGCSRRVQINRQLRHTFIIKSSVSIGQH